MTAFYATVTATKNNCLMQRCPTHHHSPHVAMWRMALFPKKLKLKCLKKGILHNSEK